MCTGHRCRPCRPRPRPALGGRAFDLTATVTSHDGAEGVIWATGTMNSGCSVFVQDGRLVVDYNAFDDHTIVESTIDVPAGDCTLGVHLERDSRTTGWVELSINGQPCGRAAIPYYMRMVSSVGSSVGMDHGSAVSDRYNAPFTYTGTLHDVIIQLPTRRTPEEKAAQAAAEMSRQ